MIALKNTSEKAVQYTCTAIEYRFEPKEIRLLEQDVVDHLLKASMTCAIGGSPLKIVPTDKLSAELLSAPAASPRIRIVRNISDKQAMTMFAGRDIPIPAKGEVALSAEVAEHIVTKRVSENRHDLELVDPKDSVPVPQPPAKADASVPSSSEEAVAPKPEEVKKKKGWRL